MSPPDPAARARTAWIVWFALVQAVLVYGAVGVFVRMESPAPGSEVPVWALVALAFVPAAVSLVVEPLLRPKDWFTGRLVRWALADAVGVLGLLVLYLHGAWLAGFGLMAFALVLLVIHAPFGGPPRP